MRILGIHCDSPHDSGVAVVEDGRVAFALNEERLSRAKNDGSVPHRSLRALREHTGLELGDFDEIWHTGWPAGRLLRISGAYTRASYHMRRAGRWDAAPWMALLKRPTAALGIKDFRINWRKLRALRAALAGFPGAIRYVSHHSAHAQAAYYAGGIPDSVALVVEGVGDNKTTSWFVPGEGGLIEHGLQEWPQSVGRYWECVTKILGFNIVRHGGKITGLAAYGDPKICYDRVQPLLWNDGLSMRVAPDVYQLIREYRDRGGRLPERFERERPQDVAAAFQRRLEEVVATWAERVVAHTGRSKLSLVGGVFANVRLNQRLHELPGVEEIMVHPAMSDAGLALGAACAGWEAWCLRQGHTPRPMPLPDAYLGPDYPETEMEAALRAAGVRYERPPDVDARVAEALADRKVVARFDGALEYGPRALGNRSILYHATDPTVNDWLNRKLDRTEFMPFAPICPFEERDRLFQRVDGAARSAEFMTITFDATARMRQIGPAAVHLDGTARPQFVRAESNPRLHRILREYEQRSGAPCLVNTSFNMHEEPIVCTPSDAVRAFLAAELDALAMGPFIAWRDAAAR
jgi:carbamoyltransferase